ncbi:MAG: T9SS type A sorting domain-containing protein [Candidatus Hatepunaea meridiana]|nr:T9SS type A sorting domain-containing protein [Candidatus Hatepunaea meridiana]
MKIKQSFKSPFLQSNAIRESICTARTICLIMLIISLFSTVQSDELELIGQLSYWDVPLKVAIDGNYVYAACGISGFRVVDVSDPREPREVGSAVLMGDNQDVTVSGEYAYVACGNGDLRIVNISDPTSPREVGHFDIMGRCTAVAVQGDYAYVGTDTTGLYVIDISDPANPEFTGSNLDRDILIANSIVVEGDYVYIAASLTGMYIFDVSDRESPVEIEEFEIDSGSGISVTLEGNYAFLGIRTEGDNLYVLDISDPENISLETECLDLPWGYPSDLSIGGNYLYVAAGADRLKILDISDPADPLEISQCNSPNISNGVAVSGDFCYVGSVTGLCIVQVSDPERPFQVGRWSEESGHLRCIEVKDNYAFAADYYGMVCVIDYSDPGTPLMVDYCRVGGAPTGMQIDGDLAFISSADGGLRIVNIDDPLDISEISSVANMGIAWDVAAANGYAYVATDEGLRIISAQNPYRPVEIAHLEFDNTWSLKVTISGDYIYLSQMDHYFYIINISNPEEPVVLGSDRPGAVYSGEIAIYGNLAFVRYTHRIFIYDISDPDDPVIVGVHNLFPIEISISSLKAYNGYLYITDHELGLKIYDFSDPESLTEVAFYDSPGVGRDVAISNNMAFLADESYLEILDVAEYCSIFNSDNPQTPVSFSLLPAFPNPFNSTTTIRYSLPFQTHVSLGVYNPLGKRINTLFEGYRESGIHTTNLTVNNLPSGLYFVRLNASDQMFTRKVMLIK